MKYLFIICMVLVSCARIPIEAVQLSDALKDESERMHTLNLVLIDKMFQEKTYLINDFIRNEYTPAYVENFKNKLPANIDYKANFTEMVQALYPRINARKDSLINVLGEQRVGIVNKLNLDYKVFSNAFAEMQGLLRSANKLNQQRTNVYAQLKALTGNHLDMESIDKSLNTFITTGGNIADKTLLLTNSIQSLLK